MSNEEHQSKLAIASIVEIVLAASIVWLVLTPDSARPKEEGPDRGVPAGDQNHKDTAVTASTSNQDNSANKRRGYFTKPQNIVGLVTLLILTFTLGAYGIQDWYFSDQEHRQLRAYVGLHRMPPNDPSTIIQIVCMECDLAPGDVAPPNEWKKRDYAKSIIKNFGSTPAHRPRACTQTLPLPLGSTGPSPEKWEEIHKGCPNNIEFMPTLWPGEERPYASTVSAEWIKTIWKARTGQATAYIVGLIEYRDDFDNPHKTYICYKYIPPPNEGVDACGNVPYEDD
jgi:hypothetical protein